MRANRDSDPEHQVVRDILRSIAEREMKIRCRKDTPEGTSHWLEYVAERLSSFQWHETNLPDGRLPPQPIAAVELISLLAAVLKCDTITPSSINPHP